MKTKIQKIDLEDIDREEALLLRNEITKATDGKLHFGNDYPALKRLFKLLQGSFENSVSGVHFVD